MKISKEKLAQDFKCAAKQNEKQWICDWTEIVSQPSVSASGEGVLECCKQIVSKMKGIGLEPVMLDVAPYPAIFAQQGHDPEKITVLIYAHYDVMPAGDRSLWNSEPFEPTFIDGKMYARGSADNKSPLMAHLEAYDFLMKQYGELPVNLKFLFEGAEESGSKGLPEFLKAHEDLFSADLVFFSDGPKNEANIPIVALGAKGNITIGLTLTTMKTDAHSRYAPILPSAAWELVELLGKLKTGDHVNVPGFYDGIVPPTEKELEILHALPPIDSDMEKIFGTMPRYPKELGYYVQLNTTPTFNLKQIHSGEGAGVVTCQATASIDIRLVEGMDPDDIFQKVKRYILELGYTNVEFSYKGGTYPSKTPVENQYVPVIAQVTQEVYGSHVIYPCRPSSAPDYLWTKILGLPAIQVRWSDPDSNNHAPNEHMTVSEYIRGIELTVKVLHALGQWNEADNDNE